MPEDNIDHMEADNAQSEGRTKEEVDEEKELDEVRLSTEDGVSTDLEKVSTDFEKVSTDKPLVSTDGSKVSTDEQIEGADDQVEGTEEKYMRDMKRSLNSMKHANCRYLRESLRYCWAKRRKLATFFFSLSKRPKLLLTKKEKGVELKDVEEIER
ncbi:hypothetical protein Tco_0585991 [Tanacetum coccineum]